MRLTSRLPTDIYLRELRCGFGSFFDFNNDRFAGFVVGKFFIITYFDCRRNHRINATNRKKNSKLYHAIGYAMADDYGTSIKCLLTVDFLNPIALCGLFFVGLLGTLADGFLLKETDIAILVSLLISLLYSALSATRFYLTNSVKEGHKVLSAYLLDPVNYRL